MLKMNTSETPDFLSKTIQENTEHYIPQRKLHEQQCIHSLLTPKTQILLKETNHAEETPT